MDAVAGIRTQTTEPPDSGHFPRPRRTSPAGGFSPSGGIMPRTGLEPARALSSLAPEASARPFSTDSFTSHNGLSTSRDPAELLTSALSVIDKAFAAGAIEMAPLFSGGHDSHTACHVASQHPQFDGTVRHIETGIGSVITRQHVDEVSDLHGWTLKVYKSPDTYEQFVRSRGFPGPGMHQWAYVRLKERCVRQIMQKRGKTILLTGCRRDESTRRMGHVEPLKIGEREWKQVAAKNIPAAKRRGEEIRRHKNGKDWQRLAFVNRNRFWTAPCFDWTSDEQAAYMAEHDLPKNPLKLSLGMSGECFCGAFASPGELDRIRRHAPDVAAEIDRLAVIARECGTHDKWGTRPPKEMGLVGVKSGPLCSSCDLRAHAAGLLFSEADDA